MIKLYNTLSRQVEEFSPIDNTVKIYTCGLTVYDQPHVGNWTGYIYWDILVRLLNYEGYDIEHTQNITDVGHLTSDEDTGEDKLEKGARREGLTAWGVAQKYINIVDDEAFNILKLIRPNHLIRATDLIEQQIEFAKKLEKNNLTYIIPGDGLYFDTSKLDNYGKLARLDISGLDAGARVKSDGKKNITDFAIWKLSPTDKKRDMEWDSPWGKGFPGWHLECSVIAQQTLGDQIDIHTGGIDHIPVHHTNEIAQTESITGKQFSRLWLHNNHLKADGQKMSKSVGNIYTLSQIIARGFSPMDFKLFVLEKHFQTEGNFSWDNLASAHNRLHNWRNYAVLRHQIHDTITDDDDKDDGDDFLSFHTVNKLLIEQLENNLDTPGAVALIDKALSKVDLTPLDKIHRSSFVKFLSTIDELTGLEIINNTPDISEDDKRLIIQRKIARDQQDWIKSDSVRDQLAERRIAIKDTPGGYIWQYSD